MMGFPLVLNELSYLTWPLSRSQSLDCLARLAQTLNEVRRIRRDCFLLGAERFPDLQLGDSFWLKQLSAADEIRDEIRVLFSFASRSPFESITVDDFDVDGAECKFGDNGSVGLLYALVLQGLAVSFSSSPEWGCPNLPVKLLLLDESSGEIKQSDCVIPHASDQGHVAAHADYLSDARLKDLLDARKFWINASGFLPHIRFLSDVERQLEKYPDNSLEYRQIIVKLLLLEEAMQSWDSGRDQLPRWRSKVTAEHEGRRQLCRFMSPSGVEETYDLHARFTPGAGRIHFRLLMADRLIEVAYIGSKL